MMYKIEQDVSNNELEAAKVKSHCLLTKFGPDDLVQSNLENHIQAHLDAKFWKTHNWQQIYLTTEQVWHEQFNPVSLHNWFVAAYYYAQVDPNRLPDLIIAWSMALANLDVDPSLKHLPWMESQSVDLDDFTRTLTELIEGLIDEVKENNLENYLQLRDLYRVEALALHPSNRPACITFHGLRFMPGCYKRYHDFLPISECPSGILGTLYTSWGRSVAACLDGDSARALAIRPDQSPKTPAEDFAKQLVSYYEGCHYLQNQQWQLAMTAFAETGSRIQNTLEWQSEIDKLCAIQRRLISEDKEHLEFAQSWYTLLGSRPSASYLAEYKAKVIVTQLAQKSISEAKALEQLNELKQLDIDNPIVTALVDEIEFKQEARELDRLLSQNKIDEAVRRAKRSRHEQIRTEMLNLLVNILNEGIQSNRLRGDDLYRLVKWAHEISPSCPDLQILYRRLGFSY